MCGIVGIFNPTQTENNVNLFEQMLYADVFRGFHSTGVFRLCADNTNTETFKKALPAGVYLYNDGWEALKGGTYPGTKGLQKLSPLYVGHNRHATIGEKTDENSHPFTEGAITLVHNGSVTKSTLSNGSKFAVDSHAICALIDEKGIDEALKEMDGAFALVWWDSESKTLNFLRNSKRPMHICKYTDGTYAWASEEDMLKWIMTRKGSSSNIVKTLERSFELPVGYLYSLHFDGKVITDLGLTKKELPSFPTYSTYYSSGSSTGSSYSSGYSQESSWEKALSEAGIYVDDFLENKKITDAIFRVENPMFTTTYGVTGRIDFDLYGLQNAIDAFDESSVVIDGFLGEVQNAFDAVEVIQYSKTNDVYKEYREAEFLYVKPTSIYQTTVRGKKSLTISVKDVFTTLTEHQKSLVINADELFPLHYAESKIQDTKAIEDKSKKAEEGTSKDTSQEGTGKNPEDKIKNKSGTEKRIKTIESLSFCCGFCASPLSVEDYKKSTTWFSGETVCETCSELADEWSKN